MLTPEGDGPIVLHGNGVEIENFRSCPPLRLRLSESSERNEGVVLPILFEGRHTWVRSIRLDRDVKLTGWCKRPRLVERARRAV